MRQPELDASIWARSSRCDSNACVEVAQREEMVAVRDNTQPDRHLTFDRASWSGLLQALREGQLRQPSRSRG